MPSERIATVPLDLARLMRAHKVTTRELAARMGLTIKRVRAVRKLARVPYLTYCDFTQAVTGENVFSRARYDAMRKQGGGPTPPDAAGAH